MLKTAKQLPNTTNPSKFIFQWFGHNNAAALTNMAARPTSGSLLNKYPLRLEDSA